MTFYALEVKFMYFFIFQIKALLCSLSNIYLKSFGINQDISAQQLNLSGTELITSMAERDSLH